MKNKYARTCQKCKKVIGYYKTKKETEGYWEHGACALGLKK